MSRVPMVQPFGQSLMAGLTTGSNIASQLNQARVAQQQLAMQQQMNPIRMAYMQALTKLTPAQQALYTAQATQAGYKSKMLQNQIALVQAIKNHVNNPNSLNTGVTNLAPQNTNQNQSLPSLTSGTAADMSAANTSGNNFVSPNSPPADIALPQSQQQTQNPINNMQSVAQPNMQQSSSDIPIPPSVNGIPMPLLDALAVSQGKPTVSSQYAAAAYKAKLEQQNAKATAQAQQQAKAQYAPQIEQAKAQATTQTQQSAADIKRMQTLQDNLPQVNTILSRVNKDIAMLANDPSLQGPGVANIPMLGGSTYKMLNEKNPQRLANMKELSSLYADLQAMKGKDFSGSRVLASALKLAGLSKTSTDEPAPMALKVLMNVSSALTPAYNQELQYYNQHGGPKLGFTDTSKTLSMPPISKIRPVPKELGGGNIFLRGDKWYSH